MATVNGINAKNIDYAQPGTGAAWTQTDNGNVLPKLSKLWSERTQKAGGSAEIYKNFQKWFDHDYQARMDKGWAPTTTDTALKNYFATGQTAGIDPGYSMLGFDKAVRGTGQHQQNKQPSFLEGLFTNMLPSIALGMVPGVGPLLAAAYGGIKGGLDSGNILGGLTGALSGYAGGTTGAGLFNAGAGAGGLSGFFSDPIKWGGNFAGNVGSGIASGVKGAFDGVSHFAADPLGTIGGGVSGAFNGAKNFLGDIGNGNFSHAFGFQDPLNGNAVPGLSTGVTTPAGGGAIVGSGQAAPMYGVGGVPTAGAVNAADFARGITGYTSKGNVGPGAYAGMTNGSSGGNNIDVTNFLPSMGGGSAGMPVTNAPMPSAPGMPTSYGQTMSPGSFGDPNQVAQGLGGQPANGGPDGGNGLNVLDALRRMGIYS